MIMTTIKLEIPVDCQPNYTNLVRISHSPAELVRFAQLVPYAQNRNSGFQVDHAPIGAKLSTVLWQKIWQNRKPICGKLIYPPAWLANDLFRTIQPPDSPPEK